MAWCFLLPLGGALGAFVFPRAGRWLTASAALGIAFFTVDLSSLVVAEGPQRYPLAGWGAPLGIELYADGLAVGMLALAAVVMGPTALYARGYFARKTVPEGQGKRRDLYWPLWLFLWAGLNALFLSADIFNLYVLLELTGLAAVSLAALEGSPGALAGAMRYLLASLTASFWFLLGVAILYAAGSTLDLGMLRQTLQPGLAVWVGISFIVIGLLIKTAVFPVHFWLPSAHAQAATPVSAVLSAVVVKASFYLLLRLWFHLAAPLAQDEAAELLGLLGAAAIFWGSLQALRQERLKLLVAYSTVAQIGYLILAIPLIQTTYGSNAWAGCLYWALSHGCAKAAMFLAAGNIALAAGHDRIADLGGTAARLPLTLFAFLLGSVSLAGLPPSGGFIAKWLLVDAAITSGQWGKVGIFFAGGLLTAAYAMRVLRAAFRPSDAGGREQPIPRTLEWIAFGLALVALLLCFAAAPLVNLLQVGAPVDMPVPGGS